MSEDLNNRLNQKHSPDIDLEDVDKALNDAGAGKPREVNMSCRRSTHLQNGKTGTASGDSDLNSPVCESKRALVVSDVMPVSHTMYKCCDCGYTWSVSTGGHFPY